MSWTSETVKENLDWKYNSKRLQQQIQKHKNSVCVEVKKSGVGPSEQNCSAPAAARRKLGG